MYEFGDLYVTNLGPERARRAYPIKTWMEEGHQPSASSDAPVSTPDPFVNLFAMVTRRTNKGTVLGAGERVTADEALHAYTWCGAFSTFAEAQRGTLSPGMDADIAVLSAYPGTVEPEELLHLRCDLTLRGYAPIFDRHGELCAVEAAEGASA